MITDMRGSFCLSSVTAVVRVVQKNTLVSQSVKAARVINGGSL